MNIWGSLAAEGYGVYGCDDFNVNELHESTGDALREDTVLLQHNLQRGVLGA